MDGTMRGKLRKAGIVVLIIGVLMLATGLILSFTIGTVAVPVLVSSSIIVNSIGVMLVQVRPASRKGGEGRG